MYKPITLAQSNILFALGVKGESEILFYENIATMVQKAFIGVNAFGDCSSVYTNATIVK